MKYVVKNLSYDLSCKLVDKNNPFYINKVLENEEVEIKKDKRYFITKFICKNPNRINHICDIYYSGCGGCNYLHVDYKQETTLKEKYINSLFSKVYNKKILHITSDNYLNYRNKVCYNFFDNKGILSLGLYKEYSKDNLNVKKCLLHNKTLDMISFYILDILKKYKIKSYDVKNGLLKHLLLRISNIDESVLITLVITKDTLPKAKDIVNDILKLNYNIAGILINVNKRDTSIVLSDKNILLAKENSIKCDILGNTFLVSNNTFFQINDNMTSKLYKFLIDNLDITKNDVCIDSYSGVSTIGICLSKYAKEVISIESNKSSVNNAIKNAKINNIKNMTFICDDATNRLNSLLLNKTKIDIVVLDPPREGTTKNFITAILKLGIKKVGYISCEPKTLKRDLDIFVSNGYKIKTMQTFDMFPRTKNIESVVILYKK